MGSFVLAALEEDLLSTALGAKRYGADFGEIGAAQGTSRQAARQAITRATAEHRATVGLQPGSGRTTRTTRC
jgi:hypothetical protein